MAETCNAEEKNEGDEEQRVSPFSNAVYKELSRINGRINQMSKRAIVSKLNQLKLSTDGNCDVLKKRLKNYYKERKLARANIDSTAKLLPYYVIIDFEATCQEVNGADYNHEIIEFPAVLVSTKEKKIVDHFQAYCCPKLKPELSDFCKHLTGISQEQVDSAEPFPKVLKDFKEWLAKNELGTKHKFAVITDGPWDMGRFLYMQCKISKIYYPNFAKKWINIRKVFSNFYKCKRYSLRLMMEHLEMNFEGRPHCGLDDARNIARVVLRLINDGAGIQVNERIHLSRRSQEERLVQPVMYNELNERINTEQNAKNSEEEQEQEIEDEEEEEETEDEEAGGDG